MPILSPTTTPYPGTEHTRLHEQAMLVLEKMAERAMPQSTARALQTALRYWSAWHQASFEEPLGLLRHPPEPTPPETVLIFIAHHAAIPVPDEIGSGKIKTGMPEHVRTRLLSKMPRMAERLVAKRNKSAMAVRSDVPAVKTVTQRVSLLGMLHERMGLVRPQNDPRIGRALSHLRKATARTVPAALPHGKRAILLDEIQSILDMCGSEITAGGRAGLIAVRDRALLLAGFGSGRRRAEAVWSGRQQQEPTEATWMGGMPPLSAAGIPAFQGGVDVETWLALILR